MIYAAILAGGVGKRVEKQIIPKQFIAIGGRPIIVRTIKPFLECDRFNIIYIAIHKEWKDYLDNILFEYFSVNERNRMKIVLGGKERFDSFINVMEDIIQTNGSNKEDILICHDSVRPFVHKEMIDKCIDATIEDNFALTVVPTTDTIHVAYDEKFIGGTLDRKGLFNGQNPSGFNIQLLHEACVQFTDEEKANITGTTQLILKLGHKVRIVEGNTSNFKITTDNDLEVAERILRGEKKTRKVQLLDCTLRDGGIAVNFDFGTERMAQIKSNLEYSGIEFIECGYIDEKKGSNKARTCFDSDLSVRDFLIKTGKKSGISYVAMIDYGTFDVNKLHSRSEDGLDGIRLAFHKEDWQNAICWGQVILSKGYDLYIQPMVSMRYTDDEFCEIIRVCNEKLEGAKGFYIVDSFGQMDSISLIHKAEIADQRLLTDMKLGFHAHNNRQMAYSNSLAFLAFNAKHDIMLDASIMGMGKGAGNLCTELITISLIQEGKKYQVGCLYDIIGDYFSKIIKEHPWGYSLDYYLSSLYSCTPSYIKIFLNDKRVSTDILIELLKTIPEDKKAACDLTFATEHLKAYFSKI